MIKIKGTCLGIATSGEILCSRCSVSEVAIALLSKFKGKNLKGEQSSKNKINSYSLNLQLTLRKMAVGIGSNNTTQVLSFLDISNCKSLKCRFFKNIELTIEPTVRERAIDSMENSIEEEVRLILNDKDEYRKYKEGNLHVEMTASFDIDWNKRYSSNRYDSLPEHTLMIGCQSKGIL